MEGCISRVSIFSPRFNSHRNLFTSVTLTIKAQNRLFDFTKTHNKKLASFAKAKSTRGNPLKLEKHAA
jgi:hypothetical protein